MANDRHDRPPTDPSRTPAASATRAEIDAFLAKVKDLAPTVEPGRRGRLIFALDATMSRQPLWDTACRLQADMFREAAAIGGLDVQLVYYRGLGECRAPRWVSRRAWVRTLPIWVLPPRQSIRSIRPASRAASETHDDDRHSLSPR